MAAVLILFALAGPMASLPVRADPISGWTVGEYHLYQTISIFSDLQNETVTLTIRAMVTAVQPTTVSFSITYQINGTSQPYATFNDTYDKVSRVSTVNPDRSSWMCITQAQLNTGVVRLGEENY